MSLQKKIHISMDENHVGLRLDRFLSQHPEIETRSRAAHLIESELVFVNGKKAKASHSLKIGDEIEVTFPEPESSELLPFDMALDIIYEDKDLIVINKPAGLVVHPAAGHAQDTLVNALLHHTKDLSMKFGENRPGIVHRIDKETSGLLVIAKNDHSHEALAQQFKNKTTHRIYYAVALGFPRIRSGKIQSYLARHPVDRKRYASLLDENKRMITAPLDEAPSVGKWAVTNYEILASSAPFHYIKLQLETGRTHQIRVHLSELGLPIVGDELYGFSKKIKMIPSSHIAKKLKDLPRFLLHAAELGFQHPRSGEALLFKTTWPEADTAMIREIKLGDAL